MLLVLQGVHKSDCKYLNFKVTTKYKKCCPVKHILHYYNHTPISVLYTTGL